MRDSYFLRKFLFSLIMILFNGTFAEEVLASCDFKTGNYIDFLSTPNSIKSIDIETNNPRKYAINTFQILSSPNKFIKKNFKKKFKANLRVNYDFGSCSYNAKIWQNGDWKDHIKLVDGTTILRSLNIKLEEGNILNATKFKLLIPETRNGLNEILGTLILKNLGFIIPETFQVNVNANNYRSKMIFQEDSQKELLERNLKREGPIFEGDETILWREDSKGRGGFNRDLENLSLSRLVNYKWFLKGESSQAITLSALSKLQEAYLERLSISDAYYYVNPNSSKNDIFADYRFLLLAMNGVHALRPHNMKFYYNSFENKFEPIYYDGDIIMNYWNNKKILISNFEKIRLDNNYEYKNFILNEEEIFINNIIREFKMRVLDYDTNHEKFIKKGINNFLSNSKYVQRKLKDRKPKIFAKKDNRFLFLKENSKLKAERNIIKDFNIKNKIVNLVMEDGRKVNHDLNNMGKIIARKKIDKERYIFLPKKQNIELNDELMKTRIPELNSEVIHNKTSKVIFQNDSFLRKLIIVQNFQDQSILINGGELNNLLITLKSNSNSLKNKQNIQRFNKRGLTGCLNIYNANFENTSIIIEGGKCEDSLNIVSSKGNLDDVKINNSFQDALDIDFSDISINKIYIKDAGNDCLDVSSGNYFINNANFENCFDKAISVGEKSLLKSKDIKILNSNIGVAVKDYSKFINELITIKNTSNCIQAFQKKQEFGGAYVDLNNVSCVGDYQVDKNSIINFR